jgi:hypothetical protein
MVKNKICILLRVLQFLLQISFTNRVIANMTITA